MSNKADIYVDESEERILNDDYKNWKKSTAFLYDLVMTHALHWPSFTFEWLPSKEKNGKVEMSRILCGATTDTDKAHLIIADVYIPSEKDLDIDMPFGTYKPGLGKIVIRKRIPHMGAVTRSRHMPQRPGLIATTSSNGAVSVFNSDNKTFNTYESDMDDLGVIPDEIPPPFVKFNSDCDKSSSLSWSQIHSGYLLTTEVNNSINLWNLSAVPSAERTLNNCAKFESHTSTVTDVTWWDQLSTVFLSSSIDGVISLWDIRSRCTTRPSHSLTGHKKSVTSVAGSPFSTYIFASGSEDGSVALWDIRHLSMKIHSLSVGNGPVDPVQQVRWSPHFSNMIASSSQNRLISIWDLDALHDTKSQASALPDNPPELIFIHGGHSSKIGDFGWHPNLGNVIGSTANDNIVQIWKPLETFTTETKVTVLTEDVPQPLSIVNDDVPKDASLKQGVKD